MALAVIVGHDVHTAGGRVDSRVARGGVGPQRITTGWDWLSKGVLQLVPNVRPMISDHTWRMRTCTRGSGHFVDRIAISASTAGVKCIDILGGLHSSVGQDSKGIIIRRIIERSLHNFDLTSVHDAL